MVVMRGSYVDIDLGSNFHVSLDSLIGKVHAKSESSNCKSPLRSLLRHELSSNTLLLLVELVPGRYAGMRQRDVAGAQGCWGSCEGGMEVTCMVGSI